jgi:hypothetical protein
MKKSSNYLLLHVFGLLEPLPVVITDHKITHSKTEGRKNLPTLRVVAFKRPVTMVTHYIAHGTWLNKE